MRVDFLGLGLDLDDCLRTRGWNWVWEIAAELWESPSARVVSAVRWDKYRPSEPEKAFWLWADSQRGKGKKSLERPWAGGPPPLPIPEGREKTPVEVSRRERLKKLAGLSD